jgi:hypothetical protein
MDRSSAAEVTGLELLAWRRVRHWPWLHWLASNVLAVLVGLSAVVVLVSIVVVHFLTLIPGWIVTKLFPDGMVAPGEERLGPNAWTRQTGASRLDDRTERFIG